MKIKFNGEMKELFGAEVSLSITKNDNLPRCLDCIKPGFLKYIIESIKKGTEFFIYSPDLDKIVFPEDLPDLKDSTVEFLVQPQGCASGVGGMLMGFGQSFAIQWLLNKLNKKDKEKKKYERVVTNSYIYNQNKNLAEQGSAIPIGYGQLRIGTKTVSSSIRNYDFDWKTTQIYNQALTELDKFNFSANLTAITSDALDNDYYEKQSYNTSDATRRIVTIGSDGAQVPSSMLGNARPNSSSNNNQNGSDGSQVTEIVTAGNSETAGSKVGFADSTSALIPSKATPLARSSEPHEYSFRPNESFNPTVRIINAVVTNSKYAPDMGSSWTDLAPYNSVGNRGEWSTIGKGKLESISLHRSVELLCEGPIAGLSMPITGNEYQGQQVMPLPVGGAVSSASFNMRGSVKNLTYNNDGGVNSTSNNNTVEIFNGGNGYEAGNVYEGSTKSIAEMIEVDPPNDSSPASIPSFNGPAMVEKDSVYYGSIYQYGIEQGDIDFISDGAESWFSSLESYIGPGGGVQIKNYIDSSLGVVETYNVGTQDNLNIIKKDFSEGNGYNPSEGNVRFTQTPISVQATMGSGISANGSQIESDQGPTAQLLDADKRRCRAEAADFANASHKGLVSAIKQKAKMSSFSPELSAAFEQMKENDSTVPIYSSPYTTSDETTNIGATTSQVARIVPDSYVTELTAALKATNISFTLGAFHSAGCSTTNTTVTWTATVGEILNCFETDFVFSSKGSTGWNGSNFNGYVSFFSGGCGGGFNAPTPKQNGTQTINTTTHKVAQADLQKTMSTLLNENLDFCAFIKGQLESALPNARFDSNTNWLFYGVGSGANFRQAYGNDVCLGGLNSFSTLHIAKDGTNELDYTPNKRGYYTPNTFPRVQVYVVRKYTESMNERPSEDYIHLCPTVIEAVASVNSEGKVTSYHLIKVPENPVIDQKITTRNAETYRSDPTTSTSVARTPVWPHSKMTKTIEDSIKAKQPTYITTFNYQDLGVILQTDDSRCSIKELIFSTELNAAKTLNKLTGASPLWQKFGGTYENFMHFGGTHSPTSETLTASHYAAAVGDTYKTFTSWQGAGFLNNSTISIEDERAINSETEEHYDPISANMAGETVTIDTSTVDRLKAATAYRSDGLSTIIGSSSTSSIRTGRITSFSVNNANNNSDFRYKKNLSDGTTVSTTFVKHPNIGISPSSGDEIKKFDIANKGQGYRPDHGTRKTKFIIYGRPHSLDTKAKREAKVAELFGCLTTDDICDEVFAYTFKAIASVNDDGEIDRISVIDAGFGFGAETSNPTPITIESLDHITPGTSTQLGSHGNFIFDEENNSFMDPRVHWNTTRKLDISVVAVEKTNFAVQGLVTSTGTIESVTITNKGKGFTLGDRFDVDLNTSVSSGSSVPEYTAPEFSVTVDTTSKKITAITITNNGSGYGPSDTVVSVKLPKPTAVNTATSTTNPVDELSWASCVYLNEVPIRDKFGRFNFSKFDIDLKTGNIHNGSSSNSSRFISYHQNGTETEKKNESKLLRNEYLLPLHTKNINYALYGPRNQGERDYFYSHDIKNRNVSALVLSIKIEKLFYIYEGDSETVYVNFAPALFGALGFFLGQKLGEQLLTEIFSALMPDVGMTSPGSFSGCISGPTTPQAQIGISPWDALGVGAKVASFFITTALALAGMAIGHILGQKVPCSAAKFLCIKIGNKIENSGEYWPARLEMCIEYFLEGQSEIKRKLVQFNGIGTNSYVKDIIIDDLPNPSGDDQNRVIKIFRITREMDPVIGGEKEARYNMSASLQSVTEVIEGVFNYPHTALVASRTNSKDFSNIPNKEYLLKLKRVKIPSNYSPEVPMDVIEASTPNLDAMYASNWDGKFKKHLSLGAGGSSTFSEQGLFWTNNPAWIIYDLITDKTFGAGKYGVNPESVDKWSFYKFAQRCDELVDVATGNTTEKEKRHTCNLYIDTEQNAYELTNQLLDNYNADLHWSAGEIFITQDAPSTEVMMFNNSNISEEGFSYSTTEATQRYTACAIDYLDEKDNYRKKTEYVEDFEGIRDVGYSKLSLTAAGVTRRGEAHRLAWHKVLTYQTEKEIISFKAGLEAAYLRPGDVIKVMDNKRISKHSGGRVVRVTAANEIEIDIPVSALGTTSTILIQRPEESTDLTNSGITDSSEIVNYRKAQFQEYTISSSSSFSLTLASNLDTSIKAGYIWMVKEHTDGTETIKPSNYKVKSITEQDNLVFDINAIEYHSEKFDAVDKSSASSGENFEARKYTGHTITV